MNENTGKKKSARTAYGASEGISAAILAGNVSGKNREGVGK
ncbi:MAG: hypothetical protein V1820_02350 [archaeon]